MINKGLTEVIIIVGALLIAGSVDFYLAKKNPAPRREFYVIDVRRFPTMDGGARILLDYSADGVACDPDFPDEAELAAFINHLGTLGTVINHEGRNE
ncbi:MAG: hypothetical protein A2001_01550 [Treponema sp. GWC1_61_84]|nr:MAG: hypothetical protein A2001_01550 [Treponema sp. GWC1_61_84]